jgi:DNA helicase II / ATP-dependent DNA helicase PcrA
MTSEFDRLFSELNPEQKKAVIAPHDAPLLVLAGAGSGKTRILTLRIAHLTLNHVPSFQILGVTFTNKAANEMRYRVERLVRSDVWISTFHSACLRILRQDGKHIGLRSNFVIYDAYDQLVLIKDVLKELGKSDRQVNPKGVREAIQRAKDFLLTPRAFQEQAEDAFESSVAEVYELYEQKLMRSNACDFGDLIFKAVSLFDQHPNVLQVWQNRFQYMLIDEYQDTNHAQYRMARLLGDQSRRVTVVGDPDQSIYAWRGADIKNILNFERDYIGCHIVKLEQNYRSTGHILSAANALIESNVTRKPKSLWTDHEDGEKISLYEADSEKEEAAFIVREILKHQDEGKALSEAVVFYRLHAQSRVLEEALRKFNIPYRIVGGVRFYDRKEIKDMIAYLRVIAFREDEVSFKRVVNTPNRGIGKKTLEVFDLFMRSQNVNWNEALQNLHQITAVGPKARQSLSGFYNLIESLRAQKLDRSVSKLLKEILVATGYQRALESERTIEAQARLENIQEFFSAIQDFEENWKSPRGLTENGKGQPPYEGLLEAFLESISLTTDLDEWDGGSNSLTLMTLHSAKGLEFPIVYMVGMEEEIFPHVNAFTGDDRDLEEERRLCYVGITRAKRKLTLTYAHSRRLYGFQKFNLPSRFLSEIPSSLYEETHSMLSPAYDFDDADDNPIPITETKRRILFD